jgi:hypothetical protein
MRAKLPLALLLFALAACAAETERLADEPPVVSFPVPDRAVGADLPDLGAMDPTAEPDQLCANLCDGELMRSYSGEIECRCGAADAGEQCLESGGCEGVCIHDRMEQVDPDDDTIAYALGICSELIAPRGCFKILPAGLDQPVSLPYEPMHICLD